MPLALIPAVAGSTVWNDMRVKIALLCLAMAFSAWAQGVIDVHSHIITPGFVSALEAEGRLMEEGFPLPRYDVESHLKWMDEAGVETSVLTLAAPQPSSALVVRGEAHGPRSQTG